MSSYTIDDERVINEAWEELLESCKKICKGEDDWNFIKRAFFLAKEAHAGVRRRSGEPYLLHPIAVAQIVINEIGLGVKSVVAALLHDVVEDTDYTVEDIEHIFGAKVASMVDGLTKMSGVFNADTSAQAEYFRKVLLTLSDDVRVILIKIADRLHNMRTLQYMPLNKQIKITGERDGDKERYNGKCAGGVPQIELHEFGTEQFDIEGVNIIPIRGEHSRFEVTGFRFGRLAYLTDFKSIAEEELQKLQGVEVLVINALRFEPHDSHFSVDEALAIVERVAPKRAYFTHMSHDIGLHCIANLRLPKGVEFAYDGLKIEL